MSLENKCPKCEREEHLCKETWSNVKIASIVIISIIVVFGLGIFAEPLLMLLGIVDTEKIFIPGFILYVTASVAAIGWSFFWMFLIRERKITHFARWGDGWKNTGDWALKILEKEAVKTQMLVLRPEKYTDFLITEGTQRATAPVSEITLTGSMVGYYTIISKALQNYLCATTNLSNTINIIATNKEYGGESYSKLAYYAYAFLSKTLNFIINSQCKKISNLQNNTQFILTVNIQFCKYDFMNASILLGDKKLAILQALDPNNVENIIDDGLQIGLMARKEDDPNFPLGKLYFERYKKVIDGWKQELSPIETWTIKGSKDGVSLEINNPFWSKTTAQNCLLTFPNNLPDHPYDTTDKVTNFLNIFKSHVCEKANTTNLDINAKLTHRFDEIPCKCK